MFCLMFYKLSWQLHIGKRRKQTRWQFLVVVSSFTKIWTVLRVTWCTIQINQSWQLWKQHSQRHRKLTRMNLAPLSWLLTWQLERISSASFSIRNQCHRLHIQTFPNWFPFLVSKFSDQVKFCGFEISFFTCDESSLCRC